MALITIIRDLHRRKARERRGLALAEGVRLVEEMVATGARCKGAVVSPALDGTLRGAALRASLTQRHVVVDELTDRELQELSATEHPQGVIAVYEPARWTLADMAPSPGRPLLVLDGVQDPGNVGTIARTAIAFGATGLVALPGTADLANPKVVRGAMGALFRLPHVHVADDDVFSWLAAHHVDVWATAMDGERIDGVTVSRQALAIVVGNEGAGIRPEVAAHASRRITIPIGPGAESLNVAVATGIVLHHTSRVA